MNNLASNRYNIAQKISLSCLLSEKNAQKGDCRNSKIIFNSTWFSNIGFLCKGNFAPSMFLRARMQIFHVNIYSRLNVKHGHYSRFMLISFHITLWTYFNPLWYEETSQKWITLLFEQGFSYPFNYQQRANSRVFTSIESCVSEDITRLAYLILPTWFIFINIYDSSDVHNW